MSSPGNSPLTSKVLCSFCGRENTVGLGRSPFCSNCGNRLLVPDPLPPTVTDIQALRDQIASLQKALSAANAVASGHAATVTTTESKLKDAEEAIRGHVETIKTKEGLVATLKDDVSAITDKLKEAEAVLSGHKAELSATKDKLKETEEVVSGHTETIKTTGDLLTTLQGELSTTHGKLQDAIKQAGSTEKVSTRLKMIASGLALMGSLSGFGAGWWLQPKNSNAAAQANSAAQVAAAQEQAADAKTALEAETKLENDTKAQFDAASKNVDDLTAQVKQLNTQVTRLNGQVAPLQTSVTAAQHDLALAKTQVSAAEERAKKSADALAQLKSQMAPLNDHIKETESTIKLRETEISRLNAIIDGMKVPKSGTLTWSGLIVGKRKIEIKDGVANYGALSGALPGKPCTVVAQDPAHVQLKTLPSARNQWNQLAFEVSGTGNLQVRITWQTQ